MINLKIGNSIQVTNDNFTEVQNKITEAFRKKINLAYCKGN